ncbi:uncharacterized protein LOC108041975 isoform X2 [Drosophila rhopaloa]|uniref:Uncharacterized protein LOC108041975 isoform X2 n=1 Tax=Drosophila rhopaloa TaxID=1041015 RepID=A0A6P4EG88_DRORH|nr:uncharacterized protein LOC108041975 isoform X2 [Drosophila rhopaloa]
MSKSEELTFRRAKVDDIKDVLSMIQELADFEKMSGGPQLTEEDLKRDAGLTGGQEYCEVYVLIDNFTKVATSSSRTSMCAQSTESVVPESESFWRSPPEQ